MFPWRKRNFIGGLKKHIVPFSFSVESHLKTPYSRGASSRRFSCVVSLGTLSVKTKAVLNIFQRWFYENNQNQNRQNICYAKGKYDDKIAATPLVLTFLVYSNPSTNITLSFLYWFVVLVSFVLLKKCYASVLFQCCLKYLPEMGPLYAQRPKKHRQRRIQLQIFHPRALKRRPGLLQW